jgi:hypothetical protein
LFEFRNTVERVGEDQLKVFPILRKQPEGEILRKLLKVEWLALWFETADEQSAALVPAMRWPSWSLSVGNGSVMESSGFR